MLNERILNVASRIENDNIRLLFYDAVSLYALKGEKSVMGDGISDCLLEFCYEEIDRHKNKIQNKNTDEENKNQNKIELEKQNSKQNSKKRGCPKGTKKPKMLGNTNAQKQNSKQKKQNSKQNSDDKNKIQNKNTETSQSQYSSALQENDIELEKQNSNKIQNKIQCEENKNTDEENKIQNKIQNYDENENENVNEFCFPQIKNEKPKTIEERKNIFYNRVAEYVSEYGKEMCREFYDYWTECNENGKKMRYEKEKVFELSKRLATWNKRRIEKQNNYGTNRQIYGANQNNYRPKTSTSDEAYAIAGAKFFAEED